MKIKRSTYLCLALLSLTVCTLVMIPAQVDACAIAYSKNSPNPVRTASEEAFIIYDERTQTEHFIRTAQFTGDSSDFGFIVPTPSKPEIIEVDRDVFPSLAAITQPKIEVRKIYQSANIGCGDATDSRTGQMPDNAPTNMFKSANVIEQKKVGQLEVAILQAETPEALRDWLSKNNYNDRPELTEWLKPYIENKWFLSAYKIASDAPAKANPVMGRINSTTVRMSFATKRPFYPYREPSDARASSVNENRLLRVYMLANCISSGDLGVPKTANWPAKKAWAGVIPAENLKIISEKVKLANLKEQNEGLFLTEFEDTSSPRPGTEEIYFGPSEDQSLVNRPAIIRYEVVDTTRQTLFTTSMAMLVVFVIAITLLVLFIKWVSRYESSKFPSEK